MERLNKSDIYRLIRKALKENGYEHIAVDDIKAVLDVYVQLVYTCLLNSVRIPLPSIGEFYCDIKHGRKEGYYNAPLHEHQQFSKDMKWEQQYYEKKPDYKKIGFAVSPTYKKRFKEDTMGE